MSDGNASLFLASILVFAATLIVVAVALAGAASRRRIARRFALAPSPAAGGAGWADRLGRIDPARLGLGRGAQRQLRRELTRAGYFDPGAPVVFALARLVVVLGLPIGGLLAISRLVPPDRALEKILLVLILAGVAVIAPKAYLKRRQRVLRARSQLLFPDYLDMLVVCINAGLGLDAALDRATRELGSEDRAFKVNLELMAGETRAGRGLPEALGDWADRLDLREAHAFAALLRQTLELGTDVSLALSTFSDEMRAKRLARAEETAAALPPKLTLPLGLCIFPVVLIVVLAPAVQKVLAVLGP